MTETLLANATLVLPDEVLRGQIRLTGGHIADMAEGTAVPHGAIDCGGDLVMQAQPHPLGVFDHRAGIHDGGLGVTDGYANQRARVCS